MSTLTPVLPNPNHPAYIKGFRSGMRGVIRPRVKLMPRVAHYQFKYGREAGLATRERENASAVPICAICNSPCLDGHGHSPSPLPIRGRVCGDCNSSHVIPIRLANLLRG